MELTFLEKGIEADLSPVIDFNFSVEIAIDIDANNAALGAVLYIFMKNYVWIEEIVVSSNYQGKGVGKALLSRYPLFLIFHYHDSFYICRY